IFRALAPGISAAPRTPGATGEPIQAEYGYLYCGPNGGGHFVKMVHNGIEYGIMAAYPERSSFEGHVSDSGEGRWTLQAAIDEGVPAPVISAALFGRFESRGLAEYADKLLSAMRYEFGGHIE